MNYYDPQRQGYYPQQPYEFLYARGMPPTANPNMGSFVQGVRQQVNLIGGIPQDISYTSNMNPGYIPQQNPSHHPQYLTIDQSQISIKEKGTK